MICIEPVEFGSLSLVRVVHSLALVSSYSHLSDSGAVPIVFISLFTKQTSVNEMFDQYTLLASASNKLQIDC